MNIINIKVCINNKDKPYCYEGTAREYKDIFEYDYLDENVIYDKKIQRITKESKKNSIIVDFLNKEIIIESKEKEISLNINVIKKEISDNRSYYLYKIDDNEIEFIFEKEV